MSLSSRSCRKPLNVPHLFSWIDILLASEPRNWWQCNRRTHRSTNDSQLPGHSRWLRHSYGHDSPAKHAGPIGSPQTVTSCPTSFTTVRFSHWVTCYWLVFRLMSHSCPSQGLNGTQTPATCFHSSSKESKSFIHKVVVLIFSCFPPSKCFDRFVSDTSKFSLLNRWPKPSSKTSKQIRFKRNSILWYVRVVVNTRVGCGRWFF